LAVEQKQFTQWIEPIFRGGRCDDEQTLATIRDVYERHARQIDPHTAVGSYVAQQFATPDVPMITLATAHPAKFPDAVEKATGKRPELPTHMADLFDRPERTQLLPNDLVVVQDFVAGVAR